eukprot:13339880-Ditylum_brightwellii.AAC.1
MAMEEKKLYNAKVKEWKEKEDKKHKNEHECDVSTLNAITVTGIENESRERDRDNMMLSQYSIAFNKSLPMKPAAQME